MNGILGSPFVVFALALGAAGLLVLFARAHAPPSVPMGDKGMPYVGGEAARPVLATPGYGFFTVALLFTLLHVAALVLALVPAGSSPWAPLAYLGFSGAAVLALRWER